MAQASKPISGRKKVPVVGGCVCRGGHESQWMLEEAQEEANDRSRASRHRCVGRAVGNALRDLAKEEVRDE